MFKRKKMYADGQDKDTITVEFEEYSITVEHPAGKTLEEFDEEQREFETQQARLNGDKFDPDCCTNWDDDIEKDYITQVMEQTKELLDDLLCETDYVKPVLDGPSTVRRIRQ
jgi:hypothetical protein